MTGVIVVGVDGSETAKRAAQSAAQALIQQAQTHKALMVVVGNRRMRGLGRVLGSIANSVAHNAPCDAYIAQTDQA